MFRDTIDLNGQSERLLPDDKILEARIRPTLIGDTVDWTVAIDGATIDAMFSPGRQNRYRLAAICLKHWEVFLAKHHKWIRPVAFETIRLGRGQGEAGRGQGTERLVPLTPGFLYSLAP